MLETKTRDTRTDVSERERKDIRMRKQKRQERGHERQLMRE